MLYLNLLIPDEKTSGMVYNECWPRRWYTFGPIVKTDKVNNFPLKSIFDLLSYFQFQTDFFSFFWKIRANFISHKIH